MFSFKVVQEGDGLVTFMADSTQTIKEFTWDFGDGSTSVTSTIGKISHTFTKNTTFQVKLTTKNSNNQVSDTKTVLINTRLARTFEDLPSNERSTLRILHIVTGKSILNFDIPNEIEHLPFDILNFTYQDHIKHHYIAHEKELDNLNFEHYYLRLTKEDSSYIAENSQMFNINTLDSYGFLKNKFKNDKERVLANKIIEMKKKVGASLLVFWINSTNLGASGYAKRNSTIAVIDINGRGTGYPHRLSRNSKPMRDFYVLAHELAHCLNVAHDSVSNYTSFLMWGVGSKEVDYKSEKQNNNFVPLRLFQAKGYKQTFMKFSNLNYDPKFSEIWARNEFSNSTIVNNVDNIGTIAIEGAMTSGNADFFSSIRQHLIYQHNVKLSPNQIKFIDDLSIPNYRKIVSEIIID